MTNINIIFSRTVLAKLKPLLKAATVHMLKDAWVWDCGHGRWEFHGPNNYYWHGRADNAYDARYKGWRAWLNATKQTRMS